MISLVFLDFNKDSLKDSSKHAISFSNLFNEKVYGISKKKIIHNFSRRNIETRSVWYPNHLQKPFKKFQSYQITKSFKLYDKALCLPSSYNLSKKNQFKIIQLLKNKFK